MAPEETEELVDYDDAEDTYVAPVADAKAPEKEAEKGSYVGIHSTGFRFVVCAPDHRVRLIVPCRDFLLKPELLRAISDLGFEHPSEGRSRRSACDRRSLT